MSASTCARVTSQTSTLTGGRPVTETLGDCEDVEDSRASLNTLSLVRGLFGHIIGQSSLLLGFARTFAPAISSEPNPEFVAKYKDAQAVIQRLCSPLAEVPDPSPVASSGTSPIEPRGQQHHSKGPRSDDGTVIHSTCRMLLFLQL